VPTLRFLSVTASTYERNNAFTLLPDIMAQTQPLSDKPDMLPLPPRRERPVPPVKNLYSEQRKVHNAQLPRNRRWGIRVSQQKMRKITTKIH
jgi:hypothetical protein